MVWHLNQILMIYVKALAFRITKKLAEQGLNVLAIEPNIEKLPVDMPVNIQLIQLEDKDKADIHLVLVDHREFKKLSI